MLQVNSSQMLSAYGPSFLPKKKQSTKHSPEPFFFFRAQPCGDTKGISLRFLEAEGVIILAFYDCRLTARAERLFAAPGQTYFGGRRLHAKGMGAEKLKKVSDFLL